MRVWPLVQRTERLSYSLSTRRWLRCTIRTGIALVYHRLVSHGRGSGRQLDRNHVKRGSEPIIGFVTMNVKRAMPRVRGKQRQLSRLRPYNSLYNLSVFQLQRTLAELDTAFVAAWFVHRLWQVNIAGRAYPTLGMHMIDMETTRYQLDGPGA